MGTWKNKLRRAERSKALQISGVYLLVGVVWILFSDKFIASQFVDPETITVIQTWKGWLFVIATSVLIYFLTCNAMSRISSIMGQLDVSEQRYRYLINNIPVVLYSLSRKNGQLVSDYVSESIFTIFGYMREEAMQPGFWSDHLHPDDRARCLDRMKVLHEHDHIAHEYRFRHKHGHYLHVHDELHIQHDAEGQVQEIIGCWHDISEQHDQYTRAWLLTKAFDNTSEGLLITDLNNRIISVNEAQADMCGYTEEELVGSTPSILSSGKHDHYFYQTMWEQIHKTGHWKGEIWNRRKNGEIYPVWLSISAVTDVTGKPSHYIGLSTDISHLKETESRLDKLAHYDPLTNLPNRLLLQSRIDHAIARARRYNEKLAIFIIDLDDFKKINDSLGHPAGDELLKLIAERWLLRLRDEDTLARFGGDEFVVLIDNIRFSDAAADVARALLDCLEKPCRLSTGEDVYIEASIGISVYPTDSDDANGLMRDADAAMYQSKGQGRNKFSFFTPELGVMVSERLEMETALRRALECNELFLHYQPKVCLKSGRICGGEALARWNRNGFGTVSPGEFIPLAERTGLIVPLGTWVLETVCRQIRTWIDEGTSPVRIAVNIAAKQFREGQLHELISGMINKFDLPAGLLTIEITESLLMDNPDEVVVILQSFREMGIHISLDDFGTGYSNIAYLSRYPIDELKIDASFIRQLEQDNGQDAAKLVKSVINLGKSLNINTVAEGVETFGQMNALSSLNCDVMQGYYFSKPVSNDEFITMIQQGISVLSPESAN